MDSGIIDTVGYSDLRRQLIANTLYTHPEYSAIDLVTYLKQLSGSPVPRKYSAALIGRKVTSDWTVIVAAESESSTINALKYLLLQSESWVEGRLNLVDPAVIYQSR
ncbi:hypothetical protein W97_08229 [Coniosporium apollinis CBS 100218]|uniref:Uncharacterized protein n=1 Tax=Coniosporium apollinis (strain CBS 100218) TaxID=1168221 RepID=R7Z4V6_CONA1|nr:uncharacterized protein W97_06045 [Coniosporium apollinis CBS 100218]XP_007784288.1 uncharacterized protein W97_08229 [Coniosporium apollinis CBS 100218]EON66930.1 hypothetical protein W97_06045 [Coniosporium apollinis CBS 100218]EON68971.1 hypothetical protein W97_08229 [Coniosporium apollinis CBS 100218]